MAEDDTTLPGNYNGAYRDVETILRRLDGIVDPQDIHDLRSIFTIGAPTKMVAESSAANLLSYWRYGNHISISLRSVEGLSA